MSDESHIDFKEFDSRREQEVERLYGALIVERDKLKAELAQSNDAHDQMEMMANQLHKELSEVVNSPSAKDAARYRFLRDKAFLHSPDCRSDFAALGERLAGCHGKEFDAIIDALIAESRK